MAQSPCELIWPPSNSRRHGSYESRYSYTFDKFAKRLCGGYGVFDLVSPSSIGGCKKIGDGKNVKRHGMVESPAFRENETALQQKLLTGSGKLCGTAFLESSLGLGVVVSPLLRTDARSCFGSC